MIKDLFQIPEIRGGKDQVSDRRPKAGIQLTDGLRDNNLLLRMCMQQNCCPDPRDEGMGWT